MSIYTYHSKTMDTIVSYLVLALALIILASIILLVNSRKNLPPGNMGWPLVGETLNLVRAGRKGTPEKFFTERMAKHSPEIFKTSLFGERMVVPCGVSGHKFVFSNDNKVVTSWWPRTFDIIAPSLVTSSSMDDGVVRLRKMISGFLAPKALKNYVGAMDEVAQAQLETEWEGMQEVNVYALTKRYTFVLACKSFLGINDKEQIKRLKDPFPALVAGLMSLPVDLPGTSLHRSIKASKILVKEILGIIKVKKYELLTSGSPSKNDLLFHMLTTRDVKGRFMTETEIAYSIIGLLIAGYDTASTAITFIMKYMAELPHVYDAVLKEQTEIAREMKPGQRLQWEDLKKMKYTWNVANETMRLTSPVQGGFQQALSDFTYFGFTIPKGYKLHWNLNTAHKNPEYFPEPEKFDPSRFEGSGPIPYSYTPFGAGSRMCPGMEYARLEILVFLHYIVAKFKWEIMLPDEKIIVIGNPKPEHGFPVRLLQRN